MGKIKTSVIILTKNRAQLLSKNLNSLAKQTVKPDQVIVVNNCSTDNTIKIINHYRSLLPIRSFTNSAQSYPELYNFGISKTSFSLICLLNDDCQADKKWLEQLITTHHQYPQNIIQGQTFSLPKHNLYAGIMGQHYQNWLKANLINSRHLKLMDSKNCAFPRKTFIQHGLFPPLFKKGSEDLAYGIYLRKKGVKIIFQPQAIAYHYERDNYLDFIKQHWRIANSESFLDRQLPLKQHIGIFPYKKTVLNCRSAFFTIYKHAKLNQPFQIIKILFIYLSLFFTRLLGYLWVSLAHHLPNR